MDNMDKEVIDRKDPKKIGFYNELFVNRLKELREEKRLSQKQIADLLGIPVSTYANWEQGRREPKVCDIFNLLLCLEIEADELFVTDNI